MIYRDHIQFFDREIAKLGGLKIALSLTEIFEAMETESTDEADEACRFFAANVEWPAMSDRTRFEVCLRLSCARWWCEGMADEESDDETGREFLESLLIEYWKDVGRVDWIYAHFVKRFTDDKNYWKRTGMHE